MIVGKLKLEDKRIVFINDSGKFSGSDPELTKHLNDLYARVPFDGSTEFPETRLARVQERFGGVLVMKPAAKPKTPRGKRVVF